MLCNFINQETVTVCATVHSSLLATCYLYNSIRSWNLHTENFDAILKSEHAKHCVYSMWNLRVVRVLYVFM